MTAMAFISGWGQSVRVWHRQERHFSRGFDVRCINLPGHGGAPEAPAHHWPRKIMAAMPHEPAIVVAWSLGGMLAMSLALEHPRRFLALAIVAGTPRFSCAPDWPHGCPAKLFDEFQAAVGVEPNRLLNRFFAMMLHGEELSRAFRQELARQVLERRQPPSSAALAEGLQWLRGLDLTAEIHKLDLPCLVIHGDSDVIVPAAAGHFIAGRMRSARELIFPVCGHAPFLTRSEAFNQQLEAWCRTVT